jgi:DNA-binding transcriptional ArsR family regulator
MDAGDHDGTVARLAAAIGDRTRTRMLYSLIDGRARTSTELAALANVTPSTASIHLQRLRTQRLVAVFAQGRHRYYNLARPDVAVALEALSVIAGQSAPRFVPNTPVALRSARTCYDHIAGTLGVALYDRFVAMRWLSVLAGTMACHLTESGHDAFEGLGIDVDAARRSHRRFAFACLDWSERRPHLAGALGAGLLQAVLKRRWVEQDLDSRILRLTVTGKREFSARFGITSSNGVA